MSAHVRTSEGDSIEEIDHRCHKVIRASAQRGGFVAVQDETPLHELIARESPTAEAEDDTMRLRLEHWNVFLEWIFADGPHPAKAMRRLYAVAYQVKREAIMDMTCADLGLLLGETKAAFSWRLGKLFEGKLRSRSQKREGARKAYAAAAKGNRSRRQGELRKKRRQQS